MSINTQTPLDMGTIPIVSTQEIVPGLICEWYAGRRIVSYRLTAVTRNIVEQWTDLVIHILGNWPQDKPYLAQHDLSAPGVSMQYACVTNFDTMNIGVSPAGRSHVLQLIEARQQQAQIAMNFNISLSGHVNKVLADNRIYQNGSLLVTYRTFYSTDKSLSWLDSFLSPDPQFR